MIFLGEFVMQYGKDVLSQAIIDNVFFLKDGSMVAACSLVTGTIREKDRLYCIDGVGRVCVPVQVSGIAVPEKGGVSSISAGGENGRHAALRITGCTPDKLCAGYLLQSEPEETPYQKAPGMEAIETAFSRKYTRQRFPLHFGTYASFQPGEAGPLDGINVYDGGAYYHFVTCGLSELYEKQNGNPDRSGYGFELTLKLKKEGLENPALEIRHVCSLLQMISGITVNNGHRFVPGQFMPGGQRNLDAAGKSALSGFVTQEDELGTLETPFGKVQLVQLIGITGQESEELKNRTLTPAELAARIEGGLTDYKRM